MREFTLMRWTKVLIVPSIILFEPVSQSKLVFNPWFLSSGSILIVAAIDRSLRAVWPAGVTKEIWMLDVLYTAGNITKAAAPFWQNRIHIYSERKVKKVLAVRVPLAEPYRLCQQDRALRVVLLNLVVLVLIAEIDQVYHLAPVDVD